MKRILLTGGTGFLGRHVTPLLEKAYDVTTCGVSIGNDIQCDLSVAGPKLDCQYDIVLHAAGKAHVIPKTKEQEKEFYDVNYQGTVNLCKSLELSGTPETLVFISTIAVYGLTEGRDIDESCPLNGNTPYAESKIMAEAFLSRWCSGYGVNLCILRLPLLVGINPPGNLGSMMKGICSGRYLSIAGGKAQKSVLMAEDIARLIPLLDGKNGIYNVCDDYHPSMRELERSISSLLGKSMPLNIPFWLAKCLALIGECSGNKIPINSNRLVKLTSTLTISNEKAKAELGWQPLNVLENIEVS